MTISDQKTDYGIIYVDIESSRYFHSEGRAGLNKPHVRMGGVSQLRHENLSLLISVTITERKRLERFSRRRLTLRQAF